MRALWFFVAPSTSPVPVTLVTERLTRMRRALDSSIARARRALDGSDELMCIRGGRGRYGNPSRWVAREYASD